MMAEKVTEIEEVTERSQALETRSIASASTNRSRSSSASFVAAKARAKLEAARAKAEFLKKESEILIEKAQLKVMEARMEASLSALKHESEVAAALAEAKVLEAAAESELGERISDVREISDRTRDYVMHQSQLELSPPVGDEPYQTPLEPIVHMLKPETPQRGHRLTAWDVRDSYNKPDTESIMQQPQRSVQIPSHKFQAPPFTSSPCKTTPQQSFNNDTNVSEIARYLARRELVNSGLFKFDDRPENYWAWKSSFANAIEGLYLSATEQLDLLSKWLGEQSSHYVRRIRAVHTGNPDTGLRKAWERLEDCYGSPEIIEKSLFDRVDSFPKISNKDAKKLRELGDLLQEVESAKHEGYLPGLTYLDTARGVAPIVDKLPYSLQEKWMAQGSQYKTVHQVAFPPFSFFCDFICREARTRNDPSFALASGINSVLKLEQPVKRQVKSPVYAHKTEVSSGTVRQTSSSNCESDDVDKTCPIHKKPHPLKRCRGFRSKPLDERKTFLKEKGVCYRCCATTTHLARDCKVAIKCKECSSDAHVAALHPGPPSLTLSEHGGEGEIDRPQPAVTSKCTEVCGYGKNSRSCSKICLAKVYPASRPEEVIKLYVILDDQSNRSLARTKFFDLLHVKGESSTYTLRTCAGVTETAGRRATGFIIESLDGATKVKLPTLIECNNMPDDRAEIPTPDAARWHTHLKPIANCIPPLDPEAQILLLLGRDILQVHKVREQRNGPNNAPYAQRLDLGWVVVGDVCLGSVHRSVALSTYRTHVLDNGRPSLLPPCPNKLSIKEKFDIKPLPEVSLACDDFIFDDYIIGDTIFKRSKDDNKVGLSIEDRRFLDIMDREMFMDESNSWVAPLPFRTPRQRLPNNRDQALTRLSSLLRTLKKKPEMKSHFVTFMQNIFDRDHAEVAPPLREGQECWYLPIFGVYHPQKPGQIRVVFDSSAQKQGISLNDVLLSGPDLNNSLLGVLLRFRRELVAVTADIEQMFHSFIVKEEDRDFLRFLWFKENDTSKEIIEYRMRVHVFGNSPSPAVAIYGLRRAAAYDEKEYGSDAKRFVEREFYVDDGLLSTPTTAEAIDLLTRTKEMLATSNLRLHKFASNSKEVMDAFPIEDHAKGLKDLNLEVDPTPIQRSLGLSWDVKRDVFTFHVTDIKKPFTRRGILATVNSLFDPLGFVAPIIIEGKFLLRELSGEALDWDSPLPEEKEEAWNAWRKSLQDLKRLEIPRPYIHTTLSTALRKELHIFSDASVRAIAAVAYLRVINEEGACHTGFVLGKAKLAPQAAHTIPRLELGAAVLAAELAETIISELDFSLDAVEFYTDSRVVLGYIYNQTRRFYVYVANRVQRIRKVSSPTQWHYVSTKHNPADHATRSVSAALLSTTTWLTGPTFLLQVHQNLPLEEEFDLIGPELDVEVRPLVTTLSTDDSHFECQRFERFSSWRSLVRAIASLIHVAQTYKSSDDTERTCRSWHYCAKPRTVKELLQAEEVVIKSVQRRAYQEELTCIAKGNDIPRYSALRNLNPYIDSRSLLRIGGRLKNATLDLKEKFPLIIPGRSHAAKLLVEHYHDRVKHQGRVFTESAIRNAGYWIVGVKKLINSILHKCVMCNKLRGKITEQKMADLPIDRLSTEPPFTYVGLDVFGPWTVVARRTRGGQAQSKRWAVLFTCMSTRAIHIELIDCMDSSTFINALRRFFALRGPVKQIRSDCGTNFVGACKELEIVLTDSQQPSVKRYLGGEGCSWVFNPPHASHMGGAWERMIGVSRRILDSMLQQISPSCLTHEVLSTLMAEVIGIVNSRPLVPISPDPDSPFLLTPAMLLTQKGHSVLSPPGDFKETDLHRQQWRQVQHLANTFWSRWRHEYLATLQSRSKWQREQRNLREGDVVLLKDAQAKRNEWPMALVTKIFTSSDGKVRTIELRVARNGTIKTFLRPISETVLLMPTED
ncbi:hypothetical protein QTP70_008781 [Hemibagrus guttatus]|uniref:Integrase catalytic domain-containing protein n=1 Tax=Hemibagrus guttatus TaxID=175788 RepID=A0AAE0VAV3_9TELE|nr:hypothetical protein QTP70_008781 [Hemibagrus guttatus]